MCVLGAYPRLPGENAKTKTFFKFKFYYIQSDFVTAAASD